MVVDKAVRMSQRWAATVVLEHTAVMVVEGNSVDGSRLPELELGPELRPDF
jgi:hypothetical protein